MKINKIIFYFIIGLLPLLLLDKFNAGGYGNYWFYTREWDSENQQNYLKTWCLSENIMLSNYAGITIKWECVYKDAGAAPVYIWEHSNPYRFSKQ